MTRAFPTGDLCETDATISLFLNIYSLSRPQAMLKLLSLGLCGTRIVPPPTSEKLLQTTQI